MIETLSSKTDALLTPMNNIVNQYWPTIKDVIGLDESFLSPVSSEASTPLNIELSDADTEIPDSSVIEYSFTFEEGPLGIVLLNTENDTDIYGSAKVSKFTKGKLKTKLQAEKSQMIQIGDIVSKISNESVIHLTYSEIIGRLKTLPRPLLVHFIRRMADVPSTPSTPTMPEIPLNEEIPPNEETSK